MEEEKIQMMKQYLLTLKTPDNIPTKMIKHLERESINYTIYKDTLYRYNTSNGIIRKVLNTEEAENIIHTYHQHPLGGHLAYNNTLHKIATRYYWDKMAHTIQQYVKNCPRCQVHGPKSLNEELYPVPVSTKPFDRIALDVKHVQTSRAGYRYIIAGIDYLTKYVEARPMRFQTSSEIALFLYEEIICRHGCPTIIVTDNGKPFLSDLIRQVCKNYSIIHKTTTPYNPQSNGLIERFNRTLGQILQRRSDDEKKDWDQYLPAALFAYRSMKQATTKHSPFSLMYGYEPKTPFDMEHQIYNRKSPQFDATLFHRTAHQLHNLSRIREQATKAIKTTQAAQKKAIEKKILDQRKELKPSFNLGDTVLVYKDFLTTSWSGKLQDRWQGPFIIHHLLGKGTYHIKSIDVSDTKIRRVHGNRLKPYSIPNTLWKTEHHRIGSGTLDDETRELFLLDSSQAQGLTTFIRYPTKRRTRTQFENSIYTGQYYNQRKTIRIKTKTQNNMQSAQITQMNNQVSGPGYITQGMKETWMRPYVPNRQDFETIQDYVNTMVNTYFVKFCQLEGYEALEKAVGNWLLECEEEFGGPGSIGYGERGQFLPREEGAVLIAKEIKDKAEIISILDIPSPTDNTPVMVPAILPPSDKIPEPQATYSDAQDEYLTPSLFEDWEWAIRTTGIELARKQMARTFYKYQEIVQHQKQMTLMKQQLTLRFAEEESIIP
ncbi:hypothetical protein G6F37_011120 [Rhizopus arrhizus]|nr:hypothetical protein G6F38_011187 [Rhizopus arrhizus]KAG1150800.1 hypothetical protein G6F37_011120 [Rhizopus arrhizus]